MPKRFESILRLACVVLALLLLTQLARMGLRSNPLAGVHVPALPTFEASSEPTPDKNSHAPTAHSKPGSGTNALAHHDEAKALSSINTGTNSIIAKTETTNAASTNVATTAVTQETAATPPAATNLATNLLIANVAATNDAKSTTLTNPAIAPAATNKSVVAAVKVADTNKPGSGPGVRPGVPSHPGSPMVKKAPELPPAILARVDRVTDSEILGPVPHPLPMALLGIAGNVAFLRSANGQTGMVKEGDELGGLKLLRIGTNRVLVEQEGEKKELMIFSGYGGESLLPKQGSK